MIIAIPRRVEGAQVMPPCSSTDIEYLTVLPDHAEIHARLLEWARWLREHDRAGRATSLEGNYRRPKIENGVIVCDECGRVTRVSFESECPSCEWPFPPMESARAIAPPIDHARAILVEKVVVRLPLKERVHLKSFYVLKRSRHQVRRHIAIHTDEIPAHLHKARSMCRNALARLESVR